MLAREAEAPRREVLQRQAEAYARTARIGQRVDIDRVATFRHLLPGALARLKRSLRPVPGTDDWQIVRDTPPLVTDDVTSEMCRGCWRAVNECTC